MVLREHNDVLNQSRGIMGPLENQGALNLQNNRGRLKQRFDLIRKLGQGTYGKVQLGIDKETGQEVAIKTIKKSKIETEADLIRIRREIQIMSSVRHPNIIHIYEVFENREKMVLVMEFAAGGELYDYLNERKILTDDEARRVFRQIASAVYYCHKHKICHRDLKLENILLDDSGNAKIADFGLSNVFDDIRLLKTFCGSPLYASPEIVRGTPYYGPEVDCWSLGVLLYTLVYGAMPFDGSNFKRLVKQISSGDFYEPKKVADSSPLIRLMLTVDPLKRASIKDVCSNPWVNKGYDQSCLNIAEDLANQTPVRLDLLLSLVPTSKINQNAIMIEPSTSTGGASGTGGATSVPSTSGHQHSSKESTKKEAPPKPKRKVMPSTSNSGSQVVKSKKSKSSPMLELILDVDEDELPPPSPAKLKPTPAQGPASVNNENDDDDAADTLSEISEIQTIAEDSELTAPIKTPKLKPTIPKNDKIDKPEKDKKREKSPQKPSQVQVQVPELSPLNLNNDISLKQAEGEKVGVVKKLEKKDPSKKVVVEKKKEAKTEQTQMIPSNESTSNKKDEIIIAKEKTPEVILGPEVNDKSKEKVESNLIKSSPQTTPPVKKKVVKVKPKEKTEPTTSATSSTVTVVEKEKTPNIEEDKDQKKVAKNEAVTTGAKKEQVEKVSKGKPNDEIKVTGSEEAKNTQEDGEPRREKLNRSNSITSQGDKSENVSPTRIERRSSKIISQKTAELIKNLDTKQSTTNGSAENKVPPPKKLVFSAFKVSDAKNKFEAKPPKPVVSKPNLPTPTPQNQKTGTESPVVVPKEMAKEKIETDKIPLVVTKNPEPTATLKAKEVENGNKEKVSDKPQGAVANKTSGAKIIETSTAEVKPLATSDSKSKLLEPTTGVDENEKKSPKTSPRPKKKIEKRATAPLPLKKVEDSVNENDLKIPATIPEKAKSKSPERSKPLAASVQLEKLKMPSNRQEIKPVFINDGSGSPKAAMMLVSGKTTPPSNFTSPEQYSRTQSRNQSMSPEPSSASISISSSKPPNFQRQQSKEQAVKNICSVIGNKVKPDVKPSINNVKTEVVFPISGASTSVSTPTSASVKERIIPIKIETDGEANSAVTSKSASVPKLPSSTTTQAPNMQVKKSFSTEPTPTPSATSTSTMSNQNPFTFATQNSHFSRQNSSDTESSMASSAPILNKPVKDQPNLIRSKREFIIPIMMESGHTVTPKEDVIANSPDIEDDKFRIDCGRLLSGRFGRRSGRFSSLLSDSSLDEEAPSISSVSASNSRRSSTSTAAPSLHTRSQSQGDEPKTPQTPQPDTPTGTYKKFRSKRGNTVDRSDSFSSIEDDEEDNFEVLTAESLFSNLLDRVRSLTRRLNRDDSVGPNFSDPFWTNTSSPLREFMSRASSEARTFSPTTGRTFSREPSVTHNIGIGLPGNSSRRSLSRDLSADSDHGSVFSDPGQSGRGGNGSLYSGRKFDSNNNTSSSNSIRSLPTRRTISCGAPSSYLSGINENSPTSTFYNRPPSPAGSYCGSLGRSSVGGGSAYSSRSSTPLYTRSMSNADYTHTGQNSSSSIPTSMSTSTASIQPQSFGRRSLKTYDRLNSTGSLPLSLTSSVNANNIGSAESYGFQRPSYLSSTSYTPTTPTISSTPFISRFSRSMSQGPPRDTITNPSTTSSSIGNSWIGRTNSTITRTAAAAQNQNDKIISAAGDLAEDNPTSPSKEQNDPPKDNNTAAGSTNTNCKLTVQEKMQNYQNYYQSLTGCPPYRRSTFLYSSGPSEIHQKSPELPEDLNPNNCSSVDKNSYSLPLRRKSLKKENNFDGDESPVGESANLNSQIPTMAGTKWPTVSLTIRQHRPLSIASFPRENDDMNPNPNPIRSVKSPTPQREMVSRIMSPPPPMSPSAPVGVQNTPDFVVNPNEIGKKPNAVKLKRDTSRATSVERITRLLENKTMSPTRDIGNIVRDPMSPKGSRPQSPTMSNSTIESGNVSQNTSGKSTPTLQDYQDQIYQQQQQQPSLTTMTKSGSRTKVFKPKFISNLEKKWEKFTTPTTSSESNQNQPAIFNGDSNELPTVEDQQPNVVEMLENAIPEETITESRLLQRALSPEKKPLNIISSRASKFGSSTVNFMLGKFNKKFDENPSGKPPKPIYVGARSDSVLTLGGTLGQNTGNTGKKILPKSNGLIIREQSPSPALATTEGFQDVEKRTKIPAIEGKVRFNRDRETSEPPSKTSNLTNDSGESVFCKISEPADDQKKQYVNKYTRPLSMISPVGSRIDGNSSTTAGSGSFIPRFQKQLSMPPSDSVSSISSICEPHKDKIFETNSSYSSSKGRNSQELSPSPNNSQSDNSYGSSNSEKTVIEEEKQSVRDRIHRKSYFNRFNSLDRKKSPTTSFTNSSSNSSSGISSGGSSRLSTNSFGSSSCINKYNPNPLFKELITDSNSSNGSCGSSGSSCGRKSADYTRSVTSSLSKLLRDIESAEDNNGNGSSQSIPEEPNEPKGKGKHHMYKKSLTSYHFNSNSNLPSLALDNQKHGKRNISPVDVDK